jgi:protein-disulfide isomerase
MVDSLFMDQGRLEEPHLWGRAEDLGLDLGTFQKDRVAPLIHERITADFRDAIRAGVATTPSVLVLGEIHQGVPTIEQIAEWAAR